MPPSREGPGFRGLSHLTPSGDARMVDVSAKTETAREAVARVTLKMKPATLAAIRAGQMAKGDVLGRGAHRRHHGGQAHARPDPPLPPAAHHRRATSTSPSTRARSTDHRRGARAHGGQDRRRDGSADRGGRGRPHRLRHGQGGGPGRGADRPLPPREVRRQVRDWSGRGLARRSRGEPSGSENRTSYARCAYHRAHLRGVAPLRLRARAPAPHGAARADVAAHGGLRPHRAAARQGAGARARRPRRDRPLPHAASTSRSCARSARATGCRTPRATGSAPATTRSSRASGRRRSSAAGGSLLAAAARRRRRGRRAPSTSRAGCTTPCPTAPPASATSTTRCWRSWSCAGAAGRSPTWTSTRITATACSSPSTTIRAC